MIRPCVPLDRVSEGQMAPPDKSCANDSAALPSCAETLRALLPLLKPKTQRYAFSPVRCKFGLRICTMRTSSD